MGQYTGDCKICKKKNVSVTSNVSGECHSCYKKRKYREKAGVEAAEHKAPVAEVVVVPDPEFTEQEEDCLRLVDEAIAGGEWQAEEQCLKLDWLHDDAVMADVYETYADLPPLPNADIVRTILRHSPTVVAIPAELADAWRDRGFQSHHVLGLMELCLSGELAVIGSEL